jgi:uncharacterized membrane protein
MKMVSVHFPLRISVLNAKFIGSSKYNSLRFSFPFHKFLVPFITVLNAALLYFTLFYFVKKNEIEKKILRPDYTRTINLSNITSKVPIVPMFVNWSLTNSTVFHTQYTVCSLCTSAPNFTSRSNDSLIMVIKYA